MVPVHTHASRPCIAGYTSHTYRVAVCAQSVRRFLCAEFMPMWFVSNRQVWSVDHLTASQTLGSAMVMHGWVQITWASCIVSHRAYALLENQSLGSCSFTHTLSSFPLFFYLMLPLLLSLLSGFTYDVPPTCIMLKLCLRMTGTLTVPFDTASTTEYTHLHREANCSTIISRDKDKSLA